MRIEIVEFNNPNIEIQIKNLTAKTFVTCNTEADFLNAQLLIFSLGRANVALPILLSRTSIRELMDLISSFDNGGSETSFFHDSETMKSEPSEDLSGTEMSSRIAILLRHWDAYALTKNCLLDLMKTSYTGKDIIILDDNSLDQSCVQLFLEFRDIHIIRSAKKLEYCATFNVLSTYARKLNADYIFVLNNDTRNFSKDIFEQLLLKFDEGNVGVVSPRVKDFDGNLIVKQDRKWLGIHFNIATEGYLIPLELWETIGGFNLNLIRFAEDLELVYQMHQRGYRQVRVDEVYFEHLKHGSSSRLNFVPVFYYARNLVWIQKLYFPNANLRVIVAKSFEKTWPLVLRRNTLNQRRYFLRKVFFLVVGIAIGIFSRLKERESAIDARKILTSPPFKLGSRFR